MALGFQNPTKNAPLTQVTAPALQGPTTRQVSADETVSGQMNKILASNSPLLQRAKTRAAQAANKRGLLNSSMGVQAGEEAVLSTAMPMAQQDASTYSNQGLVNQGAQNQFATASNKYNTDTALKQQDFGNSFQLNDQLFDQQAGAGQYLGRGLIGLNTASKLAVQKNSQDFNKTESSLNRAQQTALQEGQQDFTSGESSLNRAQQTALQEGQQDFTSGESSLNRAQQTALQEGQQDFVAGESVIDREATVTRDALLESNVVARDAALEANVVARNAVAEAAIVSREALAAAAVVTENNSRRAQETATAAQRTADAKLAATALAKVNVASAALESTLKTELANLGHTNDLALTKAQGDLALEKIDATAFANTRGAFLTSVSEITKQSVISVNEITMLEGVSPEDKTKMLTDAATLANSVIAAEKVIYQGSATWDRNWTTFKGIPDDAIVASTTDSTGA